MSERPIMDDGTPFDPSSPSHVAERLSVRTAEAERLSAELAQVKADLAAMHRSRDQLEDDCDEYEAERDTAISHLQAVLDWSNTERFAGRTRHENDAPSAARAFLLSMREKAGECLGCDGAGCVRCDARCLPVEDDGMRERAVIVTDEQVDAFANAYLRGSSRVLHELHLGRVRVGLEAVFDKPLRDLIKAQPGSKRLNTEALVADVLQKREMEVNVRDSDGDGLRFHRCDDGRVTAWFILSRRKIGACYLDADDQLRIAEMLAAPAEAGTQEDGLDALARQFKNGQTVVWGDGPTQQGAVVGFGYTIPERPGGPDRPALVVRERWGERTGHVLPSELDAHAAVSGTPDTKEDAL